jgi:hypothetical protein
MSSDPPTPRVVSFDGAAAEHDPNVRDVEQVIDYEFEDGSLEMQVSAGQAFSLPIAPAHHGRNQAVRLRGRTCSRSLSRQ